MALTLIAQLRPKDTAQVIALAKAMLPAILTVEGCESVAMLRDNEDPARVVLLERWASTELREKYLAAPETPGRMAELVSLLEEPPTVQLLSEVEI